MFGTGAQEEARHRRRGNHDVENAIRDALDREADALTAKEEGEDALHRGWAEARGGEGWCDQWRRQE
jgi:hypothetical protein